MPGRVRLPGAAELFRATGAEGQEPVAAADGQPGEPEVIAPGRGSGRVRHDEKITVYVSAEELVALERARLSLRADHHLTADRGRIVREAIAAAVADLVERGPESTLVSRLSSP